MLQREIREDQPSAYLAFWKRDIHLLDGPILKLHLPAAPAELVADEEFLTVGWGRRDVVWIAEGADVSADHGSRLALLFNLVAQVLHV